VVQLLVPSQFSSGTDAAMIRTEWLESVPVPQFCET